MGKDLKVFLCHASDDKKHVRNLYTILKLHEGISPWLDEKNIIPGQDWDLEIRKAIHESDVIIVCLSQNSINKEGYVQKEITQALDLAEEKPEGVIFIVPLKLNDCTVPIRLKRWQWVNLYDEDGRDKLFLALKHRATSLGIKIEPKKVNVVKRNFQNRTELWNAVVEIGIEFYDLDKNEITPGARFHEDLALDSIDMVELALIIEEKFGIEIDEDFAANFKTVGEGIGYLEALLIHARN